MVNKLPTKTNNPEKKNRKKPPPKPVGDRPPKNFTRPAGWLFLLIFVSGCMFILGILVGRGTAPVQFDIEDLQSQLAALRKEVLEKERRQAKVHQLPNDTKAELVFYEELKGTGSQSGSDDALPKKEAPPITVSKKTVRTKPAPRPAPVKKPQSAPGPAPEPTGVGGPLTVQVESLRKRSDAEASVARLRKKGYSAYLTEAAIPGKGTFYRVRVGGFQTKSDAAQILNRLKKDRYNGIVITK